MTMPIFQMVIHGIYQAATNAAAPEETNGVTRAPIRYIYCILLYIYCILLGL